MRDPLTRIPAERGTLPSHRTHGRSSLHTHSQSTHNLPHHATLDGRAPLMYYSLEWPHLSEEGRERERKRGRERERKRGREREGEREREREGEKEREREREKERERKREREASDDHKNKIYINLTQDAQHPRSGGVAACTCSWTRLLQKLACMQTSLFTM